MRLLYQYTTFLPPVNYFDKNISLFYILFSCIEENLALYALFPPLRGDFFFENRVR